MFLTPGQLGEIGENFFKAAHIHGGFMGSAAGGIDLGFSTGTSKRGEFVQSASSSIAATATSGVGAWVGGLIGGMIPIPGASLVGGLVGGIAGDMIGRSAAGKAIGTFTHGVNSQLRSHFGGNYTDTDYAATMRQRAAMEMGRSLLNARSFVGKEALLFHN